MIDTQKQDYSYMKRILFGLFVCTLFVASCQKENNDPKGKWSPKMTPQEFFDYRIKKSEITDSVGHMYYLYETGLRGSDDYSFNLEHRMDCKICLGIFD